MAASASFTALPEGIAGQQRPYLDWLLAQCLAEGVFAGDVITEEAIELLAQRLGTPLQISRFRAGELVAEVLQELEPVISHSAVRLEVKSRGRIPIIRSDRQKVKQIVVNLLTDVLIAVLDPRVRERG